MIRVIKRDGRDKEFDSYLIAKAVNYAKDDYNDNFANSNGLHICENEYLGDQIADLIEEDLIDNGVEVIGIEDIQDMVIEYLQKENINIAKTYKDYRDNRTMERMSPIEKTVAELINGKNDFLAKENANKNPTLVSTQRDLMAGTVSRNLARRMIPKYLMDAHDKGLIKIHDLDYYAQPLTNCELIPLGDMLEKGTVLNDKMIETPKSLTTAMTLATQIITQVTSSTYGGATITLSDLAPYVRVSKEKLRRYILEEDKASGTYHEESQIKAIVDLRLERIVRDGVQTFNYQISTMKSTNGQSPFLSIFVYLSEFGGEYKEEIAILAKEFLEQRIKGMKNKFGLPETQTFPKILFVLDEDNINPNSEYHWLLQLAMKSTALRMCPDYISAKRMKELYGDVFPCMGCRSFLFPFKPDGKNFKWYGRMNLGVCTINVPDVALSSGGDIDKFWEIFDDRMENLVKPMCLLRYDKLKGVKCNVAPLLWQYGVFGRANGDELITDVLDKVGYSISIGYNGVYEAVKYLTGESQSGIKGIALAEEIMKYLQNKADKWKEETGKGFSIYGTPQEESVDWFEKRLKQRFGIVEDITDKGYIVNSYHIDPREEVDAFTKLEIEGKLQEYSKGGNVSYIETNGLQNNMEAMYEVIKCIYENNTHAEINSQTGCSCYKCGYQGKMNYEESTDKWSCPNCGNKDQGLLSIILRVCGYLSDKGSFVKGRMKDILSRVVHI